MQDRHLIFLQAPDTFARKINEKANQLYQQLNQINVLALPVAAQYKDYFVQHHLGPRLFFSLQNSAHIIYDSVTLSRKKEEDIVFMDYGAGLGTLYMLAGMMNFKQTVYNDYLPDWQQTARSICEAMDIDIDYYVTGDIDAVIAHAEANAIRYDIVASRNVAEHIYNLQHYYTAVHQNNPACVVYSTTTANYHNLAMRWYHWHIHTSNEKKYYQPQRIQKIKALQPKLTAAQLVQLTALTRGKGQQDFLDTINNFLLNKPFVKDASLRTNTCDLASGVWCEHLLTKQEHERIIRNAGFDFLYTAGYWDTHYHSPLKNTMTGIFNRLIQLLGKKRGVVLSPFVNIVALKKDPELSIA